MSTTEDQIAFLKTAVLSEKRSFLCQNITPKAHYPYLRSVYVLSEEDEELIEGEKVRKQKVHKLIDVLVTKGSRGFDEFVRSLIQEKTQIFIAEELNRAFEDKKKRLEVLISPQQSTKSREHVPVTTNTNGVDPHDNQTNMLRKSGTSDTCPIIRISSCISDLGVDTEGLPKPVMPKNLTKTLKTIDDMVHHSGEISYLREKSIEENEDKSVKSLDTNRSRTTSSSSSVNP